MYNKNEKQIMSSWDVKKPYVSIRCTTYNHKEYIERCLNSFLMQETDFPFQIIVHDDASTDGTISIIKEYEEMYPHIVKPIYEEENLYSQGFDKILRTINEKLTGKYVAFCEGDDFWIDPQKLQKQYDFMEKNNLYIGVGHLTESVDRYGNKVKSFINSKEGEYTIQDNENNILFAHLSSYFIRTDLYLKKLNEVFSEYNELSVPGDRSMPLLFLSMGQLYVLPFYGSIYTYRSNDMSYTSNEIENDRYLKKYREAFELEKFGALLGIHVDYKKIKDECLLQSLFNLLRLKETKSYRRIVQLENGGPSLLIYSFIKLPSFLIEKVKRKKYA